MLENIIYYGITVFLSLIALGITWQSRDKNLTIKAAYIFIASVVVFFSYHLTPNIFLFLDIRYALGWSQDLPAHEISHKRFRFVIIQIIWFAIVGYLVCLYQLAIALSQRITKPSI